MSNKFKIIIALSLLIVFISMILVGIIIYLWKKNKEKDKKISDHGWNIIIAEGEDNTEENNLAPAAEQSPLSPQTMLPLGIPVVDGSDHSHKFIVGDAGSAEENNLALDAQQSPLSPQRVRLKTNCALPSGDAIYPSVPVIDNSKPPLILQYEEFRRIQDHVMDNIFKLSKLIDARIGLIDDLLRKLGNPKIESDEEANIVTEIKNILMDIKELEVYKALEIDRRILSVIANNSILANNLLRPINTETNRANVVANNHDQQFIIELNNLSAQAQKPKNNKELLKFLEKNSKEIEEYYTQNLPKIILEENRSRFLSRRKKIIAELDGQITALENLQTKQGSKLTCSNSIKLQTFVKRERH
ncbi:MAG: hypothetical protein OEY79_00775 [Anaplasmataceae bacterium]|nr:hypothetical protein [Anaplasmataceae bacterium]